MARSIIGDLVWRVVGDTSQIDSALPKTDRKIGNTAKALEFAEKNVLGLAAAFVVIAKQVFDTGKAFDSSLGNVATLLNDPRAQIEGLKDDVKDLAIETGLSLTDLSGGLYQVVSAFGDTAEATLQLEQAARAARAGLATVTDSVNLASAVTKAYGDTSAEAQSKVFDLAFQTVKLGQTTFPELASSIQKVTDGSVRLGVSQEELFTAFATLTGVTGGAAEVSTQLRAAFVALDNPTEQLAALYADLGIESGKALVEQEGLQGALTIVANASNQTGVSLNKYLGSTEAVTAASALASSQSGVYTAKLEELENSAGAANEAFDVQTESLNGTAFAYDRAVQSIEVFKTTLYDLYSGELTEAFDRITLVFEAVGNLTDRFGDLKDFLEKYGIDKILSFANPISTLKEFNLLLFDTITRQKGATEEAEAFEHTFEAIPTYLQEQLDKHAEITTELSRQADEMQQQADDLQSIVDLENERVATVIGNKDIISAVRDQELREIETRNSLGLLSEQEYNDQRLAAEEKLINDLIALGYDGLAESNGRLQDGNQLIQDALAFRASLEVETKDITNKELARLDQERADFQQELRDEEEEKEKARTAMLISNATEVASSIGGLFSALNSLQSAQNDSELARLQEQVDATEEGTEARATAEERLGTRKKVLAREEAERQRGLAIFTTVLSTATAILNALSTPPFPVGLALSVIAAATGAAQLAAINSQPLPALAAGGIVPGVPSNTDNTLAQVRSGEEIITEQDPRHSFNNGSNGGQLVIKFDPEIFADIVINDYVNTGRYTIDARGLR